MESNEQNANGDGFKPPYNLAFRTLLNLWLRMETEPPPPRIDRSYLKNMAGADQTATISALRGFGLIGEGPDNQVKPELLKLTQNAQDRPNMVAALLEKFYPEQVKLSKQNATMAMLEESFNEYSYSADTKRKAVTFFLKAAEYAGVPISVHFKVPKQRAARSTRPKTPKTAQRNEGSGKPASTKPGNAGMEGVKTVALHSGGWVKVAYEVDLFNINTRDREFVFGLMTYSLATKRNKVIRLKKGGRNEEAHGHRSVGKD